MKLFGGKLTIALLLISVILTAITGHWIFLLFGGVTLGGSFSKRNK